MSDLRRPLVTIVALAALCTLVGIFVFPGPPDAQEPQPQPRSLSSIDNLGSVTPGTAQPVALPTPAPNTPPVQPSDEVPRTTVPSARNPSPRSTTSTTLAPLPTTTTVAPSPPTTTTPTTTAPATPALNCGGATPEVGDTDPVTGQPWRCTFDDEFNGTSLDRSQWFVQTTALSGFTAGDDCYMDSPENISVGGGALSLTAVHEATPFVCGNHETQNTSGEVMTYEHFNQTYGFFEVRAKFPDVTVPGLQSTLWLWPVNKVKYGPIPGESGEIDFAEWFSQYPNLDIPNIHYIGATSTDHADCPLPDPASFHTYGLEWTPSTITILLDGQTCMVDNWHPLLPLSHPEPFDQPFFINLTQALGIDTNAFNPATTPMPATTQVDWVRVWS